MLWEDLTPLVAFSLPSSMQSEYADPLEYYNQPIEHVEDQIQAQQLNISLYSPQLNCPETQYWCPTPVSELGTDRTTPVSEVGCGTDHTTPGYDVGCGTGLPTLGTEIGYSRDLIIPGSEVGCGTGHTTPGSEIGCGTGRTTPGSEKGCGSGLRVPTPARVATPPGLVIDVEVHLPQSPGQWETFDYDLAVATLKAEAEGTKTPLIKNELRYCIQRKRKASGLDELQVEYKEEGQQQLTTYEKQKKLRRKEQNRVAAQRCRKKKREQSKNVVQEYQEMECSHTRLKHEVLTLQQEKKRLEEILRSHVAVCPLMRPSPD